MTRQPNNYVRRNLSPITKAHNKAEVLQHNHKQSNMSSDAKSSSATAGKGFRARMEHYLYSGDKKHVMAGIVLISAVFAVPWYLMNRGAKHQSHQDYLEKADKARSQRLSSGGSSSAK